jgi:hypothetical protein
MIARRECGGWGHFLGSVRDGKWRVARVIIALVLRLRRAVAARVVARVSRHVGAGEDRVGAGGEMRLRVEAVEGGYHGAVCRSIVRLRLGFGFGGG